MLFLVIFSFPLSVLLDRHMLLLCLSLLVSFLRRSTLSRQNLGLDLVCESPLVLCCAVQCSAAWGVS